MSTIEPLPDFLSSLKPSTRYLVQRRLKMNDLEGVDYQMKSESVDTRRKYELWKMKKGLLENKIPPAGKSGPSSTGMEELEAEMKERIKSLTNMLQHSTEKQNSYSSTLSKPKKTENYRSTLHINIPLTVLIPDEEAKEITTATTVLGLRSEYY